MPLVIYFRREPEVQNTAIQGQTLIGWSLVKDMERSLENWQQGCLGQRYSVSTECDEIYVSYKWWWEGSPGQDTHSSTYREHWLLLTSFSTTLVHGNWLTQGQFPSPGSASIRWLLDVVEKLHLFLQFKETLKVSKYRLPFGIGWGLCLNCTVSSFKIIKAKIPQIKWLLNIS